MASPQKAKRGQMRIVWRDVSNLFGYEDLVLLQRKGRFELSHVKALRELVEARSGRRQRRRVTPLRPRRKNDIPSDRSQCRVGFPIAISRSDFSSQEYARLHAPARHTFLSAMVATVLSEHERAAHAHQAAIFRAMTPQQRIGYALRMNATMRRLLALGFQSRHPDWSEAQICRAVADRILYARTG